MQRKTCLVTGASSGIGAAFAHTYASYGWDLILTARHEERLAELATSISAAHDVNVRVLPGDLSNPRFPRLLKREIDGPVDGLINCAGYAPSADILGTPWVDHLAFLQTMLAGPTELAYLVAPGMKERGYGRIVNVASLVALLPSTPEGALYRPVKAYMVQFSEALRAHLNGTGVHVTGLCPGFTYTDIFARAGMDDWAKSSIPPFMWQSAEEVAQIGYDACEENKPIAVCGLVNKAMATAMRLMPDSWGRFIAGQIAKSK